MLLCPTQCSNDDTMSVTSLLHSQTTTLSVFQSISDCPEFNNTVEPKWLCRSMCGTVNFLEIERPGFGVNQENCPTGMDTFHEASCR